MIKTFVIDLFCGAGGTTTAIYEANTNIEVIACVNHDKNAIKSHAVNYPQCKHYIEDIRTLDLSDLKALVDRKRIENPNCKIAIWASLECTQFSIAKCGPKEVDSRTLAEHLFRYFEILNPDFLWIENVKEFRNWGPLDDDNYPIKELQGTYYQKWVDKVMTFFGTSVYQEDILNSADFGGYTIRERLFLQFSKDDILGKTSPTHKHQWKSVSDIIDFTNLGKSIFHRKKLLVENTYKKIYNGLLKFGATSFGIKYYGQGGFVKLTDPCCTLTTKDRVFIIAFILNPQYGSSTRSITEPCGTLIARQDKAPMMLVTGSFGPTDIKPTGMYSTLVKNFMLKNNIQDVYMRALTVREMLMIQGFPKDYILKGTQTEQKKYIGNSVEVEVGKALIKSIDYKIQEYAKINS